MIAAPRMNRLETALLLLIFALPSSFQLKPPAVPVGDFYITVVELCIFIFLGHWICDLLVSGKGYKSSLDGYFVLFLSYLCLSLYIGVASFGVGKAFGDFRQYLALFLYFWALRFLGLQLDLSRIRQRIFQVMIVVSGYILLAFLFFRGKLATSEIMAERVFFDNTLLLVMCYSGYLVGKWLGSQRQKLALAVLVASGLMLLVMQVRSYWVAYAFILAASALRHRKAIVRSGVMVKVAYCTVALFFSGMLLLSVAPTERMSGVLTSVGGRVASLVHLEETLFGWQSQGASSDTETIGTRMMTAQTVWNDYVLKSPLFGTGCGGELPMVSRLGGVGLMKFSIDNGYLTVLAKFGAIGFLIYGAIIWRLCLILYRNYRSSFATEEEKLLAYSFLVGIVGMLVASFFSSIFIRQQPSLIGFLFVVAETEVMRRNIRARQRNHQHALHPVPGATP